MPNPVEMGIPTENFGDAVTIVEFLNSFSFLFDVEEELGGAITLGTITDLGNLENESIPGIVMEFFNI